jgi:very-short-patch-repair endonuclease
VHSRGWGRVECAVVNVVGSGSGDRAVAAVAGSQRTIVTREQLIACGLGPKAIAHRLRTGRLQRVFRGVYAVGCGELPPLAREQAALLVCGEGAFLSHHTAAFVWGLRGWRPLAIDVSVPERYRARREGLNVHRVGAIDRRDLRRKQGLAISSPARVLVEIAAALSGRDLERALDEGLERRLVRIAEVRAALARNRPCRGCAFLASLATQDRTTTMTRSKAEELFLTLTRKARLTDPEVNVMIGRYKADFLWRELGLIVEIDGYEFHSSRRAFEHDHDRETELEAAGWRVIRFTWRQLEREPELVLFRLGQMMASIPRARAA